MLLRFPKYSKCIVRSEKVSRNQPLRAAELKKEKNSEKRLPKVGRKTSAMRCNISAFLKRSVLSKQRTRFGHMCSFYKRILRTGMRFFKVEFAMG